MASRSRALCLSLALTSLVGIVVVSGCTADGGGDPVDEGSPTEPSGPGAQLPPPSGTGPTGDEGGPPPGKDGGKQDSGVDAGPPPPVPGTPCTVLEEIRKKTCGACGEQETICLGGKWSVYGACTGEIAGGCIPGTKTTEACGNCGTLTRTCTNYCAFTTSACAGQPAMACTPGGVDLSNAGCADPDTYHSRSCSAACAYDSFTSTCGAPPKSIEVPPTPNSTNSTIVLIDSTPVLSRPSGTCPNATLSTTVSTPYQYLKVHNPNAKAATINVYNSLAPGGVAFKTMLVAYDGAANPSGDTARKACVKLKSSGNSSLTGDAKFASMDGASALTIAAGATMTIYVAAYNAYDATKPADSTGKVKLVVQTVSLN